MYATGSLLLKKDYSNWRVFVSQFSGIAGEEDHTISDGNPAKNRAKQNLTTLVTKIQGVLDLWS